MGTQLSNPQRAFLHELRNGGGKGRVASTRAMTARALHKAGLVHLQGHDATLTEGGRKALQYQPRRKNDD